MTQSQHTQEGSRHDAGKQPEEPVKLDNDFYQNPWEAYALLREQGPVREVVSPDGVPGWLVTSYDEARALLADPQLSKDYHRAVELLPPGVAGRFASPLNAHMLLLT